MVVSDGQGKDRKKLEEFERRTRPWLRLLGSKLKELRKDVWGFSSQDALAEQIRVDRQQISAVETGSVRYRVDFLLAYLAAENGDPVETLLRRRSDLMKPTEEMEAACGTLISALTDIRTRDMARAMLSNFETVLAQPIDDGDGQEDEPGDDDALRRSG